MSVCSAPLSTSIYPATADLRKYRYRERVVGGDGGVRGSHGGKQRQRGKIRGEKAEREKEVSMASIAWT